MKKKAIKIAASTAVAASAFVAAAPAQQADAATNVKQLVTNAQNAGTVLKWAISVEGSADYKTRPYDQFNAAKKAIAAAEAAAAKLSVDEKLQVTAQLVEPKLQVFRATSYIDAITSSEKIFDLTDSLNSAISSADLGKVETAYHAASFEYKTKQAKLLDRVYGQSTRDGIRNAVKPGMEAALESVKYDVTVKMHLDKASALIKDNKLEEAAAELAKADYNLNLKDAKFSFKSQLEKSYADVAAALPLQAISASGDGKNTVTVKFSKAYTSDEKITTLEAGQFKINGLTVQSAKLSDDKKSVVLTTSTQKADTEYTVTWQGKTVTFKTAAVADTSGIAVNENDVQYKETTESRTYTAKLTNTDGTPYVGRVTVKLNNYNPTTGKTTGLSDAVLTTVNGQPLATSLHEWTGVTDSQGNLVYTVAAATGATKDTTSVVNVQPNIAKLDGDKKDKDAALTHFFHLQTANGVKELKVTDLYVSAANDYVYAEGSKYKWDANDAFFIRGQKVSQEAFETALSDGDTVTVDYKVNSSDVSTWNITVDVTKAANTGFTNPKADVRFDGFNYDLSGKGQAGNTVKVYRGSDLMGTTTINSDGTWTLRAVNLTQDEANKFTAYQFAPGKDGNPVAGTGNAPEHSASRTIYEGAFASTQITLHDQGDAGVSVNDTLEFSFLNNTKGFGHEFKEDLEGTITVQDNLSREAVYEVEYVNETTVKVVKVVKAARNFDPTARLTIESTTGVVNQDELAYNVSVSKSSKGTNVIGTVAGPTAPGSTVIADTSAELITALADSKVAKIVLDGTANLAGTTFTVNNDKIVDLNGKALGTLNVVNSNLTLVNSGTAKTVTTVNLNGGSLTQEAGATVTNLVLAPNSNASYSYDIATVAPASITFGTGSLAYRGYTVKSQLALNAVNAVKLAQADTTLTQAELNTAKTAVTDITNAGDATVKAQLQAIVDGLQTTLDGTTNATALAAANTAVDTALASLTTANIDNAEAKIAAVPAAVVTDELTKIKAVFAAYQVAEGTPSAANFEALQTAVDAIPASSARKATLQTATVNLIAAEIADASVTANASVLPTVDGYTFAVKTTTDATVVDETGKVVGASTETADVVITVTHTTSGKTADSAVVTITVAS